MNITQTILRKLSERERQILALLAQGLPNARIAAELFVSIETVKKHAQNIYKKLAVENRTQASFAFFQAKMMGAGVNSEK